MVKRRRFISSSLAYLRMESRAARQSLMGWLCCLLSLLMAGDPANSLRLLAKNVLCAQESNRVTTEDEEGEGSEAASEALALRRSHNRVVQSPHGRGKIVFAGQSRLSLLSSVVHSHTNTDIGRGKFHAPNVPLRC